MTPHIATVRIKMPQNGTRERLLSSRNLSTKDLSASAPVVNEVVLGSQLRSLGEPKYRDFPWLSDVIEHIGVGSAERSGPAEKTSAESTHSVVLYVRQDVRVDVEGHVDAGVTEDLLQHLRVLPAFQPEGRKGVAQGIEGGLLWQLRCPHQGLEVTLAQVVTVHRSAGSGREDEVAGSRVLAPGLFPPLGAEHPLLQVAATVGPEGGDGLGHEVDCATFPLSALAALQPLDDLETFARHGDPAHEPHLSRSVGSVRQFQVGPLEAEQFLRPGTCQGADDEERFETVLGIGGSLEESRKLLGGERQFLVLVFGP